MTGWDEGTLRLRIADERDRVRHAAGSPDATEIAAYARALGRVARGRAVVLGMTPELRRLAARTFAEVVAVDVSSEAIALYGEWLTPAERRGERVVRGDWMDLERLLDGRVDAVLGDGVFGNLPDAAAHAALLGRSLRHPPRADAARLRPCGRDPVGAARAPPRRRPRRRRVRLRRAAARPPRLLLRPVLRRARQRAAVRRGRPRPRARPAERRRARGDPPLRLRRAQLHPRPGQVGGAAARRRLCLGDGCAAAVY
jgi:SAM-dependent methyltransferase